MNKINNKDHRIGTYEINKILLPCFNGKIYIQNYGYNGLPYGYQNQLYKGSKYLQKLFS